MASEKPLERGMTPAKEKLWKKMYAKEDMMKLQWFHKNQQRLIEIAEKERAEKLISADVLAEVEKMRQERYRNAKRFNKAKPESITFPDIDPNCILNVMKPVDEETKRILYTNMERQGRRLYLRERYRIRPYDRYYFPETTSFVYGWDVDEATRDSADSRRFGRRQVIKNSFYRRNGSLRQDPPLARPPQQDSPTTCAC